MVCFQTKIQIWVNFGGPFNGRCWYILWTLGPFYGLSLYFMDIGIVRVNVVYIFYRFGILYEEKSGNPVLKSILTKVKKQKKNPFLYIGRKNSMQESGGE
jgi:hypothetical protein